MIVGFNHNVLYLGVSFHVQTEDGGLKSPSLVTLLYHGGIIVSSQKTSYADILGVDNLNQVVEDLAKEQHKGMLRRLTRGEFDERIRKFGIKIEGEPSETTAEEPTVDAADEASAVAQDSEEVISAPVEAETPAEPVAAEATEEPLLGEEIEELEAVPLDLPATDEDQSQEAPVVADEVSPPVVEELQVAIEPAFDPPSAEDRNSHQDVSEALDDLIFSYLTEGNEKG